MIAQRCFLVAARIAGYFSALKDTKLSNKYPLVSIGIPTYNRADGFLRETLTSALNQTYPNIEIIVSDNCSTDNTEVYVESFDDPRIRYFRHAKNIGASNNFNYCLEQARGDYFLLLHDDDLIDKDFVEICMKEANYDTDFGIMRTGTRVVDSEGNILHESQNMAAGLSTEDFFRAWFLGKTSFYFCSTLFNTKKLRTIGGLHSKRQLLQDGVSIAKLAAKNDRVDIQDIKASFRKHEGEITFAVKVKHWVEDFRSLLDLMCQLAPENKAQLRVDGKRFFAHLSYNRAMAVQSPLKRFFSYLMVYRNFDYEYPPPSVARFFRHIRRLAFQNRLSILVKNILR